MIDKTSCIYRFLLCASVTPLRYGPQFGVHKINNILLVTVDLLIHVKLCPWVTRNVNSTGYFPDPVLAW